MCSDAHSITLTLVLWLYNWGYESVSPKRKLNLIMWWICFVFLKEVRRSAMIHVFTKTPPTQGRTVHAKWTAIYFVQSSTDECKYQRINDIYNSNRYTGLDNIATMVPGIASMAKVNLFKDRKVVWKSHTNLNHTGHYINEQCPWETADRRRLTSNLWQAISECKHAQIRNVIHRRPYSLWEFMCNWKAKNLLVKK